MLRRYGWILIALALFAAWQGWRGAQSVLPPAVETPQRESPGSTRIPPSPETDALPAEAHATLQRILAGGPHPYRQDGGIFHNRERLLPRRERGWYREYTVDTPGARDRGARRIVTGGGTPDGSPPREFWYTADHYRSFRRIDAAAEHAR